MFGICFQWYSKVRHIFGQNVTENIYHKMKYICQYLVILEVKRSKVNIPVSPELAHHPSTIGTSCIRKTSCVSCILFNRPFIFSLSFHSEVFQFYKLYIFSVFFCVCSIWHFVFVYIRVYLCTRLLVFYIILMRMLNCYYIVREIFIGGYYMDMGSVHLPYEALGYCSYVYFESIIERKTTLYRRGK